MSDILRDYELLDFGRGLRRERFGLFIVSRPCLAATGPPANPKTIETADLAYSRDSAGGQWKIAEAARPTVDAGDWTMQSGPARLALSPTPHGQVGFFPDHADTWDRVTRWLVSAASDDDAPRVLHLFAYTGAGTLLWSAAGAAVTHVDASRPAVTWARRSAALSEMVERPIRWIVEDARKYVAREAKRGTRYDVVVLDPPTYGHGPRGAEWRCDRDLSPLLESVQQVLIPGRGRIALSCHTESLGPTALADMVRASTLDPKAWRCDSGLTAVTAHDGRRLNLGARVWRSRHDYKQAQPKAQTSA
jgi:23S rRNA (cytosine1962-C5)-methyltransferase